MIETNPNQYVLDYNNIKAFIEKTHGQRDIMAIAKEFTNETTKLYDMLENIHPIIDNRRIKARLIRVKNKLLTQNLNEAESDDSLSSTSTI